MSEAAAEAALVDLTDAATAADATTSAAATDTDTSSGRRGVGEPEPVGSGTT